MICKYKNSTLLYNAILRMIDLWQILGATAHDNPPFTHFLAMTFVYISDSSRHLPEDICIHQ